MQLQELEGWRQPTQLEKQYIKEMLLPRAKSDKRQRVIGGSLCIFIAIAVGITCFNEIKRFITETTEFDLKTVALAIIFFAILAGFLVLAIIGAITLIRDYGKYYKYVPEELFWVNDVTVYEDITPPGGVGYVGLIADSKGNKCDLQVKLIRGGTGERLCVVLGESPDQMCECIVISSLTE